jgi:hypothetical protein
MPEQKTVNFLLTPPGRHAEIIRAHGFRIAERDE